MIFMATRISLLSSRRTNHSVDTEAALVVDRRPLAGRFPGFGKLFQHELAGVQRDDRADEVGDFGFDRGAFLR